MGDKADEQLSKLLESLSLSEFQPKFGSATLPELQNLGDNLKDYIDGLGIPVTKGSKIRKAILEAPSTQARSSSPDRMERKQSSSITKKIKQLTRRGTSDNPLPAGWRSLTDERTGKTYYWNTATHEVTWKRPEAPAVPQLAVKEVAKYTPGSISLETFKIDSVLGTGSFGRVRLVQDKKTEQWMALKILKKQEIIRMKQENHIKNEKTLLQKANHPFIVNLLGCFQTIDSLYLVLEYVPGGELFSLLRRRKSFNNDVSVFYAGQIVLAFEHLHSLDIAYRDLKPENLLIGRDGYLKITDFGFAKEVPDEKRTYTICGTPEYLAPEIIQSRGHSTACDWWALGILIYEMLNGQPPFESETAYGIYKKVLAHSITYPRCINDDARDLLEKLLHPKPAYRLGNLRGLAQDIKDHPWFKDLDWQALEHKRLRAPFYPTVNADNDTSNFPNYSDQPETAGDPVPASEFPEFGELK